MTIIIRNADVKTDRSIGAAPMGEWMARGVTGEALTKQAEM